MEVKCRHLTAYNQAFDLFGYGLISWQLVIGRSLIVSDWFKHNRLLQKNVPLSCNLLCRNSKKGANFRPVASCLFNLEVLILQCLYFLYLSQSYSLEAGPFSAFILIISDFKVNIELSLIKLNAFVMRASKESEIIIQVC